MALTLKNIPNGGYRKTQNPHYMGSVFHARHVVRILRYFILSSFVRVLCNKSPYFDIPFRAKYWCEWGCVEPYPCGSDIALFSTLISHSLIIELRITCEWKKQIQLKKKNPKRFSMFPFCSGDFYLYINSHHCVLPNQSQPLYFGMLVFSVSFLLYFSMCVLSVERTWLSFTGCVMGLTFMSFA